MKKIIFVLSIGLLFTLTYCDKKTQKKVKASIENVIDDVKDAGKDISKEAKKAKKSVEKEAKKTAAQTFSIISEFLSDHDIVIYDVCLFISEEKVLF